MNLIIPFTKDIKFSTNIFEITSISMEHDWTYNDYELLGNFTITGEYKIHEVSVNKEPFEYVLPFSVDLTSRVIEDTINFEIKDFTYDIKDNNILSVKIEYEITANDLEGDCDDNFERMIDEAINKIDESEEKTIEKVTEDDREENNVVDEVINNSLNEETYVTYHIHIMKENETIDNICTKYKTNENVIKDYNDISTLTIGDKIIIPDLDEQ